MTLFSPALPSDALTPRFSGFGFNVRLQRLQCLKCSEYARRPHGPGGRGQLVADDCRNQSGRWIWFRTSPRAFGGVEPPSPQQSRAHCSAVFHEHGLAATFRQPHPSPAYSPEPSSDSARARLKFTTQEIRPLSEDYGRDTGRIARWIDVTTHALSTYPSAQAIRSSTSSTMV